MSAEAEHDPWQHCPTAVGVEQRDNNAMFSLMHEVLAAEEERQQRTSRATPAEHRRATRQKFTCVQLIAPYAGGRLPSQAEFQPHLCHDLSPTGFSFRLPAPVAASHLIVALGEVPFLFFVAEIVHQAYEPHSEHGGWRVGCRFIRRVER